MDQVKRTERGWAGHFICADRCLFRRNTLIEFKKEKIVVSTVGLYKNFKTNEFEEVWPGRYFETMAFHSKPDDNRYHDADVQRQVYFDSQWAISSVDNDDGANNMHEAVVAELIERLKTGLTKEDSDG